MVEREFNLSGTLDEKQKLDLAEKERIRNVAKINNPIERRKANTMLNNRDHLVQQVKDGNEMKVNEAIAQAVQKKVQPKPELHIKPPKGADHYTPKERESFIKTQIRNNLGKKLGEGVKAVEAGENKKIDEFVDKTLNIQRAKAKTTQQEFSATGEDITQTHKQKQTAPESQWEEAKTQVIDGVEVREVSKADKTRSTTGRKQAQFKDNVADVTSKRRSSSGRGGRTRKRSRD